MAIAVARGVISASTRLDSILAHFDIDIDRQVQLNDLLVLSVAERLNAPFARVSGFSWRFWHSQHAQRERRAIKDQPDLQDHRGSLACQAR
jgi:hypothetical protein